MNENKKNQEKLKDNIVTNNKLTQEEMTHQKVIKEVLKEDKLQDECLHNTNFRYHMKEELQPQDQVIYMRRTGPYGAENHALMETFKAWVKESGQMNKDSVILGIARDNPMLVDAKKCRYDVCLIVPEKEKELEEQLNVSRISAPFEILQGTLTGGKYVVFELPHTAEDVAMAWQSCVPFLLEQDYIIDEDRPILERYAKEKVEQNLCELCFPVLDMTAKRLK